MLPKPCTVCALLMPILLALAHAAHPADLVLRNGVIWTVDDDNPRASAVAISGDRIVFVGTNDGVAEHVGDATQVIDLRGRLVTPGFIDNHVHFESTGSLLYGLNLLDVSDEQTFAERIRDVNPVLVVVGEHDFVHPGDELAAAFPNGRLVTLPRTDHFATTESFGFYDAALEFVGAIS